MKRIHILAAATLAAAATASLAASGDAWYDTNRDSVVVAPSNDFGPANPTSMDSAVIVAEPVTVQRGTVSSYEPQPAPGTLSSYESEPAPGTLSSYDSHADVVIVSRDDPTDDPHNPQTGQRIGRGLFNRSGPNDFGG